LLTDTPEELRKEITERHKHYRELFLHKINTDNFREDIDPGKAIELLIIVAGHAQRIFFREIMGKSGKFLPEDAGKFLELYKEYLKIIQYGICVRHK